MAAGKKKTPDPVKIQLKKNDQVRVIAGRDRGKSGRVLDINERTGRVLVEQAQ